MSWLYHLKSIALTIDSPMPSNRIYINFIRFAAHLCSSSTRHPDSMVFRLRMYWLCLSHGLNTSNRWRSWIVWGGWQFWLCFGSNDTICNRYRALFSFLKHFSSQSRQSRRIIRRICMRMSHWIRWLCSLSSRLWICSWRELLFWWCRRRLRWGSCRCIDGRRTVERAWSLNTRWG